MSTEVNFSFNDTGDKPGSIFESVYAAVLDATDTEKTQSQSGKSIFDDPSVLEEIQKEKEAKVEPEELEGSEEDLQEGGKEKKPGKAKEKEVENQVPEENSELEIAGLRAAVNYINKTIGDVFEEADIDNIETAEEAAEALKIMAVTMAEDHINSLKEKNEMYKMVFSVAEKGGDLKSLLEIYKKEEDFVSINIDDERGGKEYLKTYYIDILGYDKQVANRKIENLSKIEDGIKDEIEIIKPAIQKHFDDRKNSIKEEADLEEKRKVKLVTERKNDFVSISQDLKLTKETASQAYKTLFGQERLEDGQLIDSIDLKIGEFLSNSKDAVMLSLFLSNREKYDAMVLARATTEKTIKESKKIFDFKNTAARSSQVAREVPKANSRPAEPIRFN